MLSEGQKQKVLLARALASTPDLAFFDEPTAAMDVVAETEVLGTLARIRDEQGIGLVVVSHFLEVAARYADRVLFLDADAPVVLAGSPTEVFSHESFRARYGRFGEKANGPGETS